MYGTQGTRGRAHGAQGTRGAHVRETYNAHLKPIIGHTLVYKGTARYEAVVCLMLPVIHPKLELWPAEGRIVL